MSFASVIETVTAAVGCVRSVADVLGSFRDLVGTKEGEAVAAAKQQMLDLEHGLLVAKFAILDLEKENYRLTEHAGQLERLLSDRDKGKLHEIAPGAFGYVLGDLPKTLKRGPWYCQPCFENGRKIVFQRAKREFGFDVFQCSACGGHIKVPNDLRGQIRSASATYRLDGF